MSTKNLLLAAFTLIFLFTVGLVSFASEPPRPILDDDTEGPHAATVLMKMEDRWEKIETFHTGITQLHKNADGIPLARYVGEMWLSRPNRIRINYRRTPLDASEEIGAATEHTHVIWTDDPNYIYEYNIEENTVARDAMSGISSLPFIQAVVGIEAFKEKEFREKYWVKDPVPVGTYDENQVYLLQANPKRAFAGEIFPFEVYLGKEDAIPRFVLLHLPEEAIDEKTLEIRLRKPRANPPINEEVFTVLLPEDVTVIRRDR